jgi:hypothetical protein
VNTWMVEVGGKTYRLRGKDHGDSVPGIAEDGKRYRAFTSWFGVDVPEKGTLEFYSQVNAADAEASGEVERFRAAADRKALGEILTELKATDEEKDRIFGVTGVR